MPSNTFDLTLILNADSLHTLLPFIDSLPLLAREMEKDYLFLLLSRTNLTEKAKIALATKIIYKSNYLMEDKTGSMFAYFLNRLKRDQFQDTKLLKYFILNIFRFTFNRSFDSKQDYFKQYLSPIINNDEWKLSNDTIDKLLISEFVESIGTDKLFFENRDKKLLDQFTYNILLINKNSFRFTSKVIIKNLLYLFFTYYPQLVIPLLKICLTIKERADIKVLWASAILDFIMTDYPIIPDNDELVKELESLIKHSQTIVRLGALTAIWLITDNNNYLENSIDDKAARIRKRCNIILKSPESKRKYYQSVYEKYMKKLLKNLKMVKKIDLDNFVQNEETVYSLNIKKKYSHFRRVIAFQGSATLDDVHNMIQTELEWDDDHLYSFFMDNNPRSYLNYYNSTRVSEGPFAKDVKLCDLGLYPTKEFLYIFDFGDNHNFSIKVKEITTEEKIEGTFPKVISRKGKSPDQYPDW